MVKQAGSRAWARRTFAEAREPVEWLEPRLLMAFSAHVNFQPAGSEVPQGYAADNGSKFGTRANGQQYGWNDTNANTRDRNAANSPDQRYDTLNFLKWSGAGSSWEIAVPNGTYTVHLVAGDPSFNDSVYKVNVEGLLTVDGTPTSSKRWIEGTRTVTVTDGRLTVKPATGASNVKLCFIDIDAAATPPVTKSTLSGLTLVSAVTQGDIRPLGDNGTIDLFEDGKKLNIRANPGTGVGSVVFKLDANASHTETSKPLALTGDNNGVYNIWTPSLGAHKLTVTPYSGANATGTAGAPLVVNFVVTNSAPAPVAGGSALWGVSGENMTPQGRLPDFSYAGYHSGDASPPTVPIVSNVKTDYGAVGDGVHDDSNAFLAAIKNSPDGAIYIPEGRYKITKVLQIKRSNLVLRGAGAGKSILYMPDPLVTAAARQAPGSYWDFDKTFANPERQVERIPISDEWHFRGGFVWIQGQDTGGKLGNVTAPALRGDRTLTVSDVSNIAPGQFVRLIQIDDAKHTLGRYLEADQQDTGPELYDRTNGKLVDWAAKVVSVDGNQVTFDRPLRVDVRLGWQPQIYAHTPTVQESGVEDLGFQFSGKKYAGHLHEDGFNAIFVKQADNVWIRNVNVTDADIAINMEWMVRFSQVENVRLMAKVRTPDAYGRTGHHGLQVAYLSQDNLVTNFRLDTHYVHDISVDTLPNGNVFSHGSGKAINFDHHRGAPYENLFTDIDVGDPTKVWDSSGNETMGPPAGARETFWNIRASSGKPFQALPGWVQANIVGIKGYTPSVTAKYEWVEATGGGSLLPADLYLAQLARRHLLESTLDSH